MFERLRWMLFKEFIQVFRDPRMRVVIFLIPCVQVLVIGYAVSTDVKHVRTAVCDFDNSRISRELISQFAAAGYFDIVARPDSDREVRRLLDSGHASVVLQFNHGFSAALAAGRSVALQLIIDGTDSHTANIAAAYATKIAAEFSRNVLVQRLEHAGLRRAAVVVPEMRIRAWFNENLESRNFFVPGVLAIVIGLSTILLTSMAVVREKEIGTIEQILVTPIRSVEFILGKTIPFAIIGLVEALLVTIIGVFWFEVPIRGQLWLLFTAMVLFLMNTLGAGLLISTVSHTQQQAMMTTFLCFFPAMLLSGFAFPIANMPPVVQYLTLVNPMRYFLVLVRSIFLKGVGLETLWLQLWPLLVMGMVLLYLAVRRFHKTL